MDYRNSNNYTKEEWKKKESLNYEITHDIFSKLNMFKDYQAAYSNPRCGKILVEFKGVRFEIDITPLNDFMEEKSFDDFSRYLSRTKFFEPMLNGFCEKNKELEVKE